MLSTSTPKASRWVAVQFHDEADRATHAELSRALSPCARDVRVFEGYALLRSPDPAEIGRCPYVWRVLGAVDGDAVERMTTAPRVIFREGDDVRTRSGVRGTVVAVDEDGGARIRVALESGSAVIRVVLVDLERVRSPHQLNASKRR